MATLLQGESRRLYSWWWDSHISPKNSKWLQENLTDMDAKVKTMIKLIEEDADSFARRAEMYYKKRPELMKLVEEFYRAYRALAERYDHATGALRQAHKTMAEAFPNQVPFALSDDSPSSSSANESGPHTPDMPHPLRAFLDPDDLHKDAMGVSSSQFRAMKKKGAYSDESDSISSKKGLKQLNDLFGSEGMAHHAKFSEGRVRKGLNFHEEEGSSSKYKARNGSRDLSSHEANGKEQSLQDRTSAQSGEAETQVQTLTDAIAKLEAETEASLLQYQQSLERLSNLEAEVSRAHEDSKGLNERARKAEDEVETLKQSLARLEDEKEAGLLQYHQCSERISNLEAKVFQAEEDAGRLNERASKAETEVEILEQALAKIEAEKEAGLLQYHQCLERISNLETRISQAEKDAGGCNERAVKAEAEAQTLMQTLGRLEAEKEAGLAQYKLSLEMISNLETKLANAGEDARNLTKRAEEAENDVQSLKQALAKIEAEKEAGLAQYKQCVVIISNLETRIRQAEEDAAGYNEQVIRAGAESQSLKQAFALLESEKEACIGQYQQSLETISNLETKISNSEEDATRLAKRAEKAEADVESLKQVVATLESEKEAAVVQYKRCLEMISNLETKLSQAEADAGGFNERASKAEAEAQSLKQTLARLESEKEAVSFEYNKSLEAISNMETKIFDAEEDARKLSERAENAEATVQSLKKVVSALHEEKETAAQQYQHCMETISNLEAKILRCQEEASNLNTEIAMGAANLSSAEEQNLLLERANQSLQGEVDTLAQLTATQKQELLEKHEELDRLQLRIQEECLRSEQVESSLQSFQDLLCQSQEERKSLAMELQRGVLMLMDVERWNQALEDEVQQLKEENRSLNEQNSSSDMSIKALNEEIFSWREVAGKLEEEVSLRTDQRNALQQEIYCLKEEVNDLNRRHQDVIKQVESVGLKPDSLGSSVQDLQVEISNLKEICQKSKDEKVILLEKLENMEKLLQRNVLLENSLSDANAELDGLRKKVKALEESYEYLQGEKFVLVAEKATLISQLELVSDDMEKLLEKNTLVENSLSDANAELEYLREKSTNLEESYLSLDNEKSDLLTERDTLVFHLQNIQRRLEELEKKSTELEEKYSDLEEEKTSTLLQVEGLQNSLDLQKQEHATFVHSSETRLAHLEDQILVVQEEGRWRKKEFEEEQDKAMNAQLEIFILQSSIRDMEEKNFSMLIECQQHYEASKMSEQLICELEQEYLEQQVEAESLVSQLEGLRTGIRQVLKFLEIDPEYEGQHEIEEEKMLLQHILGKIEEMKKTSLTVQDENQQLLLEKSVVATLLGQLRLEAADLEVERNTLTREINIKSGELHVLQSEKQKILELNEQFRSEVKTVEQREKALKAEMQNLSVKLKALREENLILRYDLCEARDENISLEKKCSELEERNGILEDENNDLLEEAIALDNLFLVSKSYGQEKAVELVGLGEDLDRLHDLNNELNNKFSTAEQTLASVEMENMDHKGSIVKFESELETVRNTSNQLKHQLQTERNVLCQKEIELSEAEMKLKSTESENLELHSDLEVLRREREEVRLIMVELEKQNLKHLEDSSHQSNEIRHLREATDKLETELAKLHVQIEDGKIREKNLSFELQNEVKLREAEAATLYADNQISVIHAALYEEKVHKLIGACERLEDDNISKQTEIEQLKERNGVLEGESRGLKSKLAAYLPVIVSLRENIISLEDSALSKRKILLADYQEPKDVEFASHLNSKCCQDSSEGENQLMEDGVSDLQELQTSVKSIEEALKEMESLAKKEILNVSIRLQAAMKEIEDLKCKSSIDQEKTVQSSRDTAKQLQRKHGEQPNKLDSQKAEAEISELGKEILMKDIPLDQISECSSYDHGFGPHGLSKRETMESDDQMLELWETSERDSSLSLTRPENMRNVPSTSYHQSDTVEQMSDYPSSELQAEKELAVDKLELSKRLTEPHQEANKRKILERLASDAQKLTNLQITIHDLKKKMEAPKKNKKAKGAELDSVQRQLQVIEEHIVQLAEVNRKLTKNAEEKSLPYTDRNTGEELEDSKKVRRRRVSEQAREGSEKIGRLQLEVQRIQFLLLKLEDEHGAKAPVVANRSTGILLRDFIYTGRSKDKRKKKVPCCACMRPSTKEE